MSKTSSQLFPTQARLLTAFGQRLKDARLRRRLSMDAVAARADLSRPTLYRVERGDPAVAMGAYLQVLRVLGLENSLGQLALDDELGRALQDEALPHRQRAPRRMQPGEPS